MKKLAIFTLIAMLLVTLTVPFSSAYDSLTVLKGTPVVDGKLDGLYVISAQLGLENPSFYSWGTETSDADARVYYLWDDNYLYYCVDVYDSTLILTNDGSDKGGNDENPWRNDAIEMWFNDEDLTFKLHSSVGGMFFIGTDGDGRAPWGDISKAKMASTVKADGTGYYVEVAIPMNGLAADRTFVSCMQVNDVYDDERTSGTAHGLQYNSLSGIRKGIQNHTFKLSADPANPDLVLKHTPALDGKLDDAYLKSASGTIRDNDIWAWGGADRSTSTANMYFLWDDNYFYVAVDVNDSTLITSNDSDPSRVDNPWMNDSAELWFRDGGLLYKIHCGVGGAFFVGTDKDGMASFDFSKAQLKTSVKDGNTGYVLEAAFPLTDLAAGRAVALGLQLNDVYAEDRSQGDALGGNVDEWVDANGMKGAIFVLSDELAEPAPVTDAPAPDTQPQGGTTPSNPAPATLDAGVIVAAVALVSLAGIVVAKKRH